MTIQDVTIQDYSKRSHKILSLYLFKNHNFEIKIRRKKKSKTKTHMFFRIFEDYIKNQLVAIMIV